MDFYHRELDLGDSCFDRSSGSGESSRVEDSCFVPIVVSVVQGVDDFPFNIGMEQGGKHTM